MKGFDNGNYIETQGKDTNSDSTYSQGMIPDPKEEKQRK